MSCITFVVIKKVSKKIDHFCLSTGVCNPTGHSLIGPFSLNRNILLQEYAPRTPKYTVMMNMRELWKSKLMNMREFWMSGMMNMRELWKSRVMNKRELRMSGMTNMRELWMSGMMNMRELWMSKIMNVRAGAIRKWS